VASSPAVFVANQCGQSVSLPDKFSDCGTEYAVRTDPGQMLGCAC